MKILSTEISKLEIKIQQEIEVFLQNQVDSYEKAKKINENFESLKKLVDDLPGITARFFETQDIIPLETIEDFNIIEKFATYAEDNLSYVNGLYIPTGPKLKEVNEIFSRALHHCVNSEISRKIAEHIKKHFKEISNPIYKMYSDRNFDYEYFWTNLLDSYLQFISIEEVVKKNLEDFYKGDTVKSIIKEEFMFNDQDQDLIEGTLGIIFEANRLYNRFVGLFLERKSLEQFLRHHKDFKDVLKYTLDGLQHIKKYNSDEFVKVGRKKKSRKKFNFWLNISFLLSLTITFAITINLYINVNNRFKAELDKIWKAVNELKEATPPSENEVMKILDGLDKRIRRLKKKFDDVLKDPIKEEEDLIKALKEKLKKETNETK